MGAKSWRCSQAQNSVSRLHARAAQIIHLDLTHQDVIEMFVPPHLREMCFAVPLNFRVYSSASLNTPIQLDNQIRFSARVELCGSGAPALPNEIKHQLGHPGFEELKLYAAAQYEILKQWSLVRTTFDTLWDTFEGNVAQMRFFWPSLLVIFDHSDDEELQNIANDIRTAKTPRRAVSIPQWLSQACRETAATLAAVSLLPDSKPSDAGVRVDLHAVPPWMFEGESINSRV